MIFGCRVVGICILHVLSAIFTAHGVDETPGDKQKPTQSRPVNLCTFFYSLVEMDGGLMGQPRGVVNI